MRLPFKAPRLRLPAAPSTALYVTVVPAILAVLSLVLFAASALLLEVWTAGWTGALILLILSAETFFLPYVLLPLATRLPALLPWVRKDLKGHFDIDGEDRLAQRILVGALILLPGLTVLAGYDPRAIARMSPSAGSPEDGLFLGALNGVVNFLAIPIQSATGTVIVFAILTIVLAIPDIGRAPKEN